MGVKCGGRRSEAAALCLPGDLPLQGGWHVGGRTCSRGLKWMKPRPEVGVTQHYPSPCWFGLRHFGYGGAATSASRPSLLFLLFALQLPKTDLEGPRVVQRPWRG